MLVMSDKLNPGILDGISTKALSKFSELNPSNIKKIQTEKNLLNENATIAPKLEIKVVRSKENIKSVNELIKNVVVRAKVEADRSNNNENIARYNEVVDYALDNQIITSQELDAKYQEVVLKENNQRAEVALKNAEEAIAKLESTLQKLENFEPEEFSEIYIVGFELKGLLELDLDSVTKAKVSQAFDRVQNMIKNLENKVDNVLNSDKTSGDFKNPFSFFGNLFSLQPTR